MLLAVLERLPGVAVSCRYARRSPVGSGSASRASTSRWSSRSPVRGCGATPERTVAVGEVGLGGEMRSVPQLERRLESNVSSSALAPPGAAPVAGIDLDVVLDVDEAVVGGLLGAA